MSATQHFFPTAEPVTIRDIVGWTGAQAQDEASLDRVIDGVGPLSDAGATTLSFIDNARYGEQLAATQAAACLVPSKFADKVPACTTALLSAEPYRAFAIVLGRLFPEAMRPVSVFGIEGIAPGTFIHPSARLEDGVTVDPGAVIGPEAEIGAGTVVGANSVIGPSVKIGRNCSIGAHATITHALIGNRVLLYPGVRIGQDGFGYAMGPKGHKKVPQIGRVIIQDDVEIGANTTIDRGSIRDTVIGEGAKIDNLVQIAHNVVIGRHCVIVSQGGISGSTTLGDFAVTGGQAGLAGHLTIGAGAQIGAKAGLMTDVPAGAKWVGSPAQPVRSFFKQEATLRKLSRE